MTVHRALQLEGSLRLEELVFDEIVGVMSAGRDVASCGSLSKGRDGPRMVEMARNPAWREWRSMTGPRGIRTGGHAATDILHTTSELSAIAEEEQRRRHISSSVIQHWSKKRPNNQSRKVLASEVLGARSIVAFSLRARSIIVCIRSDDENTLTESNEHRVNIIYNNYIRYLNRTIFFYIHMIFFSIVSLFLSKIISKTLIFCSLHSAIV
jgi:hypothetical protein